jgi:hypothetical protein
VDSPGGDAREALRTAALTPHVDLTERLDEVRAAHPSNARPRYVRELADTFMATTCRHLAAVDDTLLPRARTALDEGHDLVADFLTSSRHLEQALHTVKASLYGDAHARGLHGDALWEEVAQLLAEHDECESVLVDGLAEALDDEELRDLAEHLRRTEEHAPTRPHAYTPHTGLLGRVGRRAWFLFDTFWDNAEGRVIPKRIRPPHPRRDSLLTRYVMGVPRFEDPERGGEARR